jgi:hypothetical protein
MSTTDWPYAADGVDRDEFAASLRLPLICDPYPGRCYITAVIVSVEPHLWHGVRPTDEELRAVASFHDEYVEYWYNQSWKVKMRQKPFDLDCGANGRYLIKYPNGGWGYRHRSWRTGPCLVPTVRDAPSNLMTVLARSQGIESRWDGWVAAHEDVFSTLPAATGRRG